MPPLRVDESELRRLADEAAQRPPAPAAPPAVASVEALQRSAGNAVATQLIRSGAGPAGPGEAFSDATSGTPSPLPHRARMESAFGQSFAGISAHVGTSQAQRGLARLGARAAAFGSDVAFAESNPDPHDVAHELAHVVQQRGGGRAVQAKAAGVSAPGDRAELAADRAADAVMRDEPAPPVGTADGATLHRTRVKTNGGEFDNGPMYAPRGSTGAVGTRVGAAIMVDFIPGELAEAPAGGIVLVQTVKGVTDRVPGTATLNPARDQGDTAVSTDTDESGLVAPNGFAVDVSVHRPGRGDPNHNPIYGVGFGATAPSATLNDGTPSLGRTQRGAHVRNPITGVLDPPVNAQMEDGPGRIIGVAGQTFEMNFEIAALITAGPMVDTYLGSVEWGWQSDAAGNVTLKPFVPLASGAPTADFMQAAGVWNNASFHDDSLLGIRELQDFFGLTTDSVDLPITTLALGRAGGRRHAHAGHPHADPRGAKRAGGTAAGPSVDRTNKQFELRALMTELVKRKIDVELFCNSISDTGSAASPAEDEVWLALNGGGSATIALTATKTFRPGMRHKYQFAVSDFLPLTDPVHIEVNEHDRAGPGGAAHDDVLIGLDWTPPFMPALRNAPGGTYAAFISFDK